MSDDDLKALYSNTQGIHQNESNGASDSASIVNPTSGAEGSMQVMKDTQKDPGFGVKPSDGTPEDTARAGRDYYAAMHQRYGDPFTAAVAYNWGPGKADKWIKNGSKLEDLPEETLKYVYKMQARDPAASSTTELTPESAPKPKQKEQAGPPVSAKPLGAWDALGEAVQHPGDTAAAIGSGLAKTAKDFVQQAQDNPAQAAKGALLGSANGLTFGTFKNYIQPALSKVVNGGSFADAQLRVKDMYDAQGPATTVGELGSAFIPGPGQASLVAKAVNAVPTASRVARAGAGMAAGAVEGVANYAGRAEGDLNAKDAAANAIIGGTLGTLPAVGPATVQQKAASFIRKEGDNAANAAENIIKLKSTATRDTIGGAEIAKKEVNRIGKAGLNEVSDAVEKLPDSPDKLMAQKALNRFRDYGDDASLNGLEQHGPASKTVADAIRKAQRLDSQVSEQSGASAIKQGLAHLGGVAGGSLGSNMGPVGAVMGYGAGLKATQKLLGTSGTHAQMAVKRLIKQDAVAQEVLNKLGPSAATKGLQDLTGQGAAHQASLVAAAAQEQATKAAADAAKVTAKADSYAEKYMKRGLDAGAQAKQDIADQAMAQAKQAQQTQKEAAAILAQQAKAQQAAKSAAEKSAADQQKAAASRAADIAKRTASYTQERQATSAEARAAKAAEAKAKQVSTPDPQKTAMEQAKALAAEAKAKQDRQAAIDKRTEKARAERSAYSKSARREAAAAADKQAMVDKAVNGDFDIENPKAAALLSHVDHPDTETLKASLQKIAKEDPEHAETISRLFGTGEKAPAGKPYYNLQRKLQDVHGSRVPEKPAETSSSSGVLSKANIENDAAYAAGIENRQQYARKTHSAAPEGPVKELVHKLSTMGDADKRMSLYNKVYAKASESEKKFMDDKVEHMIHYGNEY
jgi:hypothetical protein